jgi:hypothetical protein
MGLETYEKSIKLENIVVGVAKYYYDHKPENRWLFIPYEGYIFSGAELRQIATSILNLPPTLPDPETETESESEEHE